MEGGLPSGEKLITLHIPLWDKGGGRDRLEGVGRDT